MSFTAQLVHSYKRLESDAFGTGGRVVYHQIGTVQVTGATRQQGRLQVVSGGVSGLALNLEPMGDSAPGSVLLVHTNQILDLRLNSASGPMICNVVQLVLAGSQALSALYLTNPGTTDAVLYVELIGGGSLQASVPLP